MSAQATLLREAARLMRQRAEAANTDEARRPYGNPAFPPVPRAEWGGLVDNYLGGEIGIHCASWHPAVALAVADWLDGVADDHRAVESVDVERGECVVGTVHEGFYRRTSARHILPALAVARAYLGGVA